MHYVIQDFVHKTLGIRPHSAASVLKMYNFEIGQFHNETVSGTNCHTLSQLPNVDAFRYDYQ